MNYLQLILQFWKLRRSKRITSLQADLYFFLIQECNDRGWENPFECSNKLICAGITTSEPSLIDARNRLKQLGLIDFQGGRRNEASPVYTIFNLKNLSRNRTAALDEPLVEPEQKPEPIIHKQEVNNKEKQKSKSHSSGKPPAKEKKEPEYWKPFVAVWDSMYLEKTNSKYMYFGKDWAHLKTLYTSLKKRAAEREYEFNEKSLTDAFRYFVNKAWEKDEWLRQNFTVSNVLSQLNPILNGTAKASKQPTGAAINSSSIVSRINSMPD